MTYLAKAKDLYDKVNGGQLMDAFEQYYGDNVVMTEPRGTREGKDACREYEKQFLASVKEFHGAGVNSITSNEEDKVTTVESWMDITFQDGNRVRMEQVAVQRWEGDHIVHERFYYQ